MINTQTNYYCIIYTIFLNQFVFSFKYNVHLKETRKYYTLKGLKFQFFQPFFTQFCIVNFVKNYVYENFIIFQWFSDILSISYLYVYSINE